MHRLLEILLLAIFLPASALPVRAQHHPSREGGYASFDMSFRQLRNNAVPDFSSSYDDYIPYVPAAAVPVLKLSGYESRSGLGRMAVSGAFSAALMTGSVYALKYSVSRIRPDGSSHDSFPSGHAARSFMAAAILHEEYGWRSPWFSFGGYAVASVTGITRILNDRHWTSDVIAGAVLGIASVKLGYFLADQIFKDKYLCGFYGRPAPGFDEAGGYYDIGLFCGYRFIFGKNAAGPENGILTYGSSSGIEISVPVSSAPVLHGTAGVAFRASADSWAASDAFSFNRYGILGGAYWQKPFAGILEADTRILAGYSFAGDRSVAAASGIRDGAVFSASCGLSLATGANFKIKAFAAYEAVSFTEQKPFMHSAVLGGSALFFW